MPYTLEWSDIVIRLLCAVAASALFGLDRSEHARPAGLRTTMLVCLAAAVAMVQTNVLLPTLGKTPEAFSVLDLMRLPLGILTGMGFIGAGAIVRRGNMVQGVTTAATLWFVTVIGLCFGGGQLGLGGVATGLGLATLWGLHGLEYRLPRDRRATLIVTADAAGPTPDDIRVCLLAAGCRVAGLVVTYKIAGSAIRRTVRSELRWRGHDSDVQPPAVFEQLASRPGVLALRWEA